jgi:hypothetical protein
VLAERAAKMLTTLVHGVIEDNPNTYRTPKDFICGLQDSVLATNRGQRLREVIKASFFTNQVYRVTDMNMVEEVIEWQTSI